MVAQKVAECIMFFTDYIEFLNELMSITEHRLTKAHQFRVKRCDAVRWKLTLIKPATAINQLIHLRKTRIVGCVKSTEQRRTGLESESLHVQKRPTEADMVRNK